MGVFSCTEKDCKNKGLLSVSYIYNRCDWCGYEMTFVSDCVPETAVKTDDGLYYWPEGEKNGEVH
jgi:hypothetical protein